MYCKHKFWLMGLVFSVLVSESLYAEDTLTTVMARMRPETAVRIRYHETRFLDLIDKPWHGAGYMYALAPDIMVKEQTEPVREIAGASGNLMFYYDPVNDIRHQQVMADDDPISLNVLVFKALVNGDQALLEKIYQIDFFSGLKLWRLTLAAKSKRVRESLAKIVISGLPEQLANKIVVYQTDGDYSEFVLKPDGSGEEIRAEVTRLYKQLREN